MCRQLRLLDVAQEEIERTLEDDRGIAARDLAAEQVLHPSQLVVGFFETVNCSRYRSGVRGAITGRCTGAAGGVTGGGGAGPSSASGSVALADGDTRAGTGTFRIVD